jgi:hypothetical protein
MRGIERRILRLEEVLHRHSPDEPSYLEQLAYHQQQGDADQWLCQLFEWRYLMMTGPGCIAVGSQALWWQVEDVAELAEWLTEYWRPGLFVPLSPTDAARALELLECELMTVYPVMPQYPGLPPLRYAVGVRNGGDGGECFALGHRIEAAMAAVNAQTGSGWEFTPDGVREFLQRQQLGGR